MKVEKKKKEKAYCYASCVKALPHTDLGYGVERCKIFSRVFFIIAANADAL